VPAKAQRGKSEAVVSVGTRRGRVKGGRGTEMNMKDKRGSLEHCLTMYDVHARDFKFNVYLLNFHCLLSTELGADLHLKFKIQTDDFKV